MQCPLIPCGLRRLKRGARTEEEIRDARSPSWVLGSLVVHATGRKSGLWGNEEGFRIFYFFRMNSPVCKRKELWSWPLFSHHKRKHKIASAQYVSLVGWFNAGRIETCADLLLSPFTLIHESTSFLTSCLTLPSSTPRLFSPTLQAPHSWCPVPFPWYFPLVPRLKPR